MGRLKGGRWTSIYTYSLPADPGHEKRFPCLQRSKSYHPTLLLVTQPRGPIPWTHPITPLGPEACLRPVYNKLIWHGLVKMQVCCVSYLFDVENYCCSICWAREEEIWVRWPSDTDHVVEVAPQAFVNAPVLPTNALLLTENAARGGPHSLIQSWFWNFLDATLNGSWRNAHIKRVGPSFLLLYKFNIFYWNIFGWKLCIEKVKKILIALVTTPENIRGCFFLLVMPHVNRWVWNIRHN